MAQIRLVFDPDLKVNAQEIADLWASDPEAREILTGPPEARRERPGVFLPGVVEFVVLPLAVNVASTILIDLTTRIYRRYRPAEMPVVEEIPDGDGDRTVVTRRPDQEDTDTSPRS